jgi:hypothetical protein
VDGREGQGLGIGRRGADQEIGVPEGNIIVALQSRIIHHPAMRKLADTGMFEGKQIKALAIGGPIVAGARSVNVHSVASVAQNEIAPLTVRRGLIGNAENRAPIFARGQASPTANVDGFAAHDFEV